jgi:hypothetical protein
MPRKSPPKAQSERFKEAARELGVDESEERFNEALRKVAKHKPPPDPPETGEKPKDDKPGR